MATANVPNQFKEDIAEKVHNLGSDSLKVVLSNTAIDASDASLTDLTEITAGNGYTAGGNAATVLSSAQSGGTYSLVLNAITITAAGGSIGPFRYVALINSTASNKVVAYFDRGAAITLADGESYTIQSSTWLTNA